jgi:hypothetical protein
MRFLAALFLAVAALTSPALAQAVEKLENITALRIWGSGVRICSTNGRSNFGYARVLLAGSSRPWSQYQSAPAET